jgi:hypothetical protein
MLMAEATKAFAELVPSRLRRVGGDWRDFRVDDPEPAAGLVEWLNETVALGTMAGMHVRPISSPKRWGPSGPSFVLRHRGDGVLHRVKEIEPWTP